jgi:hypothetical protein
MIGKPIGVVVSAISAGLMLMLHGTASTVFFWVALTSFGIGLVSLAVTGVLNVWKRMGQQ